MKKVGLDYVIASRALYYAKVTVAYSSFNRNNERRRGYNQWERNKGSEKSTERREGDQGEAKRIELGGVVGPMNLLGF